MSVEIVLKCIILICFFAKIYRIDSTLEIKTFKCKNGNYIQDDYFCSGFDSCGDNSNENDPGCQRGKCPSGRRFSCDNTCKPVAVRCNTKPDCLDGSDESNCENEPMIDDCTWQKGKYLCEDNLKCIYFNNTCNGQCNCYDCSDEKPECLNDKEMEEYMKRASSYTCFRTPNGPHCCSEFDSLCHECGENQCEHKCIEFRQQPKCLCDENYNGVPDTMNRQCISSEARKNTLIYSTENSIEILDLFTNTSHVIREKIEATALASAHNHVYYATFANGIGHIFTHSISSNETCEITNSDSKILSIAIDWITNSTYYSTNKSKIVACSKDGKICKQLKSIKAHSIGLAPRFGLLFWVETKDNGSSSQYIMKSGMDGSDEALLAVCDKISWPVEISVDELKERIYFWTSLMELSFISFTGNRKKILQPKTHSPADRAFFTVFEKKVYYSLFKSNQILVAGNTSKLFDATLQMSRTKASSINHLYAYNPQLQRTKIANPCEEICTDGLCLLCPFTSKAILNYTCFRDGFDVSSEHSNENHTGFLYGVIIYAFVALIFIICLKIAMYFLIRWKKMQFRNDQSMETDVPLESCKNNELLLEIAESSTPNLNINEYKKYDNCNKLEYADYKKKMANNLNE